MRIDDVLAGRYRLVERLGAGGMAQVFRAVDEELHRDVAIKVLAPHLLDDPKARDRFRREARAAASLNHPGVVTMYDTVVDGEHQFLVMELVDGPTLADRLESGPLEPDEAVRLAREIAAALEVAHRRGVVHCDIKPGNLLLTAQGTVKVADFGIARAVDATQTTTGQVYGSLPYLAPERARGDEPDARSDLYALGCVLYEMLTGRAPFQGRTPTDTLGQHLHAEAPPPSQHNPAVTADDDAVVMRLLAKDPADRYPDARSLRADLDALAAAPRGSATVRLPAVLPETTPIAVNGPGGPDGDAAATTVPAPDGTSSVDAPGRRARSRRLLALAAALAVVLVALWLAGDRTPAGDGTPATSPSSVATPSPAPSATPSVEPSSETPSEPQTPEDAVAVVRRLLREGRAAGLVSRKGEEEIDKRLAEVLAELADDKPGDAVKKAQDLRKELDDLVEDGEVDPLFAEVLRGAVDDVRRLARG